MNTAVPAIWFPTVRTGTGTDVFTQRLVADLCKRGVRAEITWLPLRAEYAPWTMPIPRPPAWATVAHVNTWLHTRFIPRSLPVVATIHHAVHHPDASAYKGPLRAAYHRWWIAPNERRVLRQIQRVVAVSQFVAASTRHRPRQKHKPPTRRCTPKAMVVSPRKVQKYMPPKPMKAPASIAATNMRPAGIEPFEIAIRDRRLKFSFLLRWIDLGLLSEDPR